MNKIKKLLQTYLDKFIISIKNFPLAVIYLFTISIYCSYLIIIESLNDNNLFFIISLLLGFLTSLFISLYKNNKYIINIVLSILMCVVCYLYLEDNIYRLLTILAMGLLLIIAIIFLLFKENHNGKLLAYLISFACYVLILCIILLAGINIVLAAIHFLIYQFNNYYKLFFISFFFIFIFFGLSLFISSFIHEEKNIEISKVYVMMVHRVALTLYYLLLFVLYIYLIKILFTFKMPVGQLNWFASFALLFNVFFYISSEFDESSLTKFHKRFGGLILIPIFIIQSIAIYIRVDAYGLTTLRYLSIIFNLIGLSFIISSIIKKKLFIYPITIILILVAFVSPLNIIDVPVYNQQAILTRVLVKNNMLKDNTIIPKQDISIEDKYIINSAFNYLKYSESNKLKLQFKDNFIDTFGFDINELANDYYCYYGRADDFITNIDDYSYFKIIEDYSNDCIVCGIDLSQELFNLKSTYGTSGVLVGENQSYEAINDTPCFSFVVQIDDNSKIIFDDLSFSIVDNKIQYFSYHGYKLSK